MASIFTRPVGDADEPAEVRSSRGSAYTYSRTGTFSITLTATDSSGVVTTSTRHVTVTTWPRAFSSPAFVDILPGLGVRVYDLADLGWAIREGTADMAFLEPAMLDTATLREVQLATKKDLKVLMKRVGHKDALFVAARDIKLKDGKKISVFVAADKSDVAKAWYLALKAKKPPSLAQGTCAFELAADKKTTKVLVKKVAGADRRTTALTVGLALRFDPTFQPHDAQEPDPTAPRTQAPEAPAAPPAPAQGRPDAAAAHTGTAERDHDADPLGWLTRDQVAQAEEIFGSDWRDALSDQLDDRWGRGWTRAADDAKRRQFDKLLPGLALPFAGISDEELQAVDQLIEGVQSEALDNVFAQIPDIARRFGLAEDEVAEIIAAIPPDEFAKILAEELSTT